MKRGNVSSITYFLTLLMVLAGGAYAQLSPSDDIRESNDPARAAEVERKAEAISGRSLSGSGESGEESSEATEKSTLPAEKRSEGKSGGTQGGSEAQDEGEPLPESSGETGSEAPYGGEGYEGRTNQSSPPDLWDPYY